MFPARLPAPANILLQSIFFCPPSLLSSVGWNIISLLSKSCSLPPAHLSWRCLLCTSSSVTHDSAFSCRRCDLLLLPNPQPAFPPFLLQLSCFTLKCAVPSLGDVGHCHPKAKPQDSSRVGQVAQHLKRGCRPSSCLGGASALLSYPARKRKDLTQQYYLPLFLT